MTKQAAVLSLLFFKTCVSKTRGGLEGETCYLPTIGSFKMFSDLIGRKNNGCWRLDTLVNLARVPYFFLMTVVKWFFPRIKLKQKQNLQCNRWNSTPPSMINHPF